MVGLFPVVFALALASSRRELARCGRGSAATPTAADNTPGRPASMSASPVKAKDDANNTSQASAAAALGDGAAFDWFTRGGGRRGFGLEGGKCEQQEQQQGNRCLSSDLRKSTLGITTFVVIFFGSNLIKHLGWRAGALTTPVIMALLAAPLFGVVVASKGDLGGTQLAFAVMVGTVQSVLSKATKYALFDPTTQMAYIPLDEESKVKGKAAIDGLGSRLGKSGASLMQQGLVLAFGNILNAAPVVAVIFYAALGSWTYGAVRLADMFEAKTRQQEGGHKLRAIRTRGGGGHDGGSSTGGPVDDDSTSSREEGAKGLWSPRYRSPGSTAATGGLLHRRATSRDCQA